MRRTKPANRVTIRIANQLAELEKVVDAVTRFGADHELPKSALTALIVALEEILNNTVSYGYVDARRHEIVVTLSLKLGELVAEVRDDGIAFDPLSAPAPDLSVGLLERKLGGVGLHFVRSLMDNIEYTRKDGSNRLRLSKSLETEDGSSGDH